MLEEMLLRELWLSFVSIKSYIVEDNKWQL